MAIIIPKNELNEFSLPRVCVTTGKASSPVTFQKVQFQYIPKWIAIFGIAPLLYRIFFMLMRKTANGTLPFSDEGWAEVKAARRNVLFAVLALIGSCVAGGVMAANLRDVGPLLMLALIVLGIVAIVVTSVRVGKVYPMATFIDDRAVTLKLPSEHAERLFEQHLSAGSRPRV